MALGSTIYKLKIALSDLDRQRYETLGLTVAQHPSETLERMMSRVLVYCLNAEENLAFGKGLSSDDEPDIWLRTLDSRTALWIEVGEPTFERVKKATHVAQAVKVYSFNTRADVWWNQGEPKFSKLDAEFFRLDWADVQALAQLVQRNMDLSITISDASAFVADQKSGLEVHWKILHQKTD